jgi:signal transduction histidine kinase
LVHLSQNDLRNTGNFVPLLRQIESGQIIVRGEAPLASLIHTPFLPTRFIVLDLSGRVERLVYSNPAKGPLSLEHDPYFARHSSQSRQRLVADALTGRHEAFSLPVPRGVSENPAVFASAPLRDRRGHIVSVLAVQVPKTDLSTDQIVPFVFALFGATTIALVIAAALPMLGLASLFSYFMARSLTRRLEAVSSAATALAGGDLARRAPVMAHNEIGTLADNFNRMAIHLEETMDDLEHARGQAVDALRARRELVAGISHELRTPLAIIRAHIDALLAFSPRSDINGATGDEQLAVPESTLEALQREAERLGSLIEDLFALSRAETGALEVHRGPLDVVALADEVATAMRPLAQKAGMIALSVEAAPGLPLASADGERLRQIIANLVRNAVRHTNEGGIVVLSVTADSSWVIVSVADTGSGISPDHLPHVFERFYRADDARTHSEGGAVLGLAIVRELVELMGGKVSVESELGEGSCFRVYLPRLESPARPASLETSTTPVL